MLINLDSFFLLENKDCSKEWSENNPCKEEQNDKRSNFNGHCKKYSKVLLITNNIIIIIMIIMIMITLNLNFIEFVARTK